MLFSGLLIALHKMLHCFLLGLSFVGSCGGQKSPPPSWFWRVFCFSEIFAAVAVVFCSTHAPESVTAVSAAHLVWFVVWIW